MEHVWFFAPELVSCFPAFPLLRVGDCPLPAEYAKGPWHPGLECRWVWSGNTIEGVSLRTHWCSGLLIPTIHLAVVLFGKRNFESNDFNGGCDILCVIMKSNRWFSNNNKKKTQHKRLLHKIQIITQNSTEYLLFLSLIWPNFYLSRLSLSSTFPSLLLSTPYPVTLAKVATESASPSHSFTPIPTIPGRSKNRLVTWLRMPRCLRRIGVPLVCIGDLTFTPR